MIGHTSVAGWPDFGKPASFALIKEALNRAKKALRRAKGIKAKRRNLLIHCKAGVGRTVTLICMDICQQLVSGYEAVSAVEVSLPYNGAATAEGETSVVRRLQCSRVGDPVLGLAIHGYIMATLKHMGAATQGDVDTFATEAARAL